jgi:hypothetical protein
MQGVQHAFTTKKTGKRPVFLVFLVEGRKRATVAALCAFY